MTSRRADLWAVLFAATFPTFVTWLYFQALEDYTPSLRQTAYAAGKTLQFAFPVLWVLLVQRQSLKPAAPQRIGLAWSVGFGGFILVAMLLVYFLWLERSAFFAGPAEQVREKVAGLGLDSPGKMIALGVFYSLVHSFLEEYYWRWFVFAQLRRHLGLRSAIGLSSVAFMAHHVLLLSDYFGWASPLTYLFSVAIAVGGAVWAWIYERTQSLLGPWLSHLLVDAGIFIIGYTIMF